MKIVTVKSREFLDDKWCQKLMSTLNELNHEIGKKFQNYTAESLDLAGHLGFHLLADENDGIITFCGVYNGGRYPNGVYRILNRVFVHPGYRSRQFGYPSLASHHLLAYQLELYKSEIKAAFVSREGINGRRFLSYWLKKHAPKQYGPWYQAEGFVKVTPDPLNYQSSYQQIAYRGDLWNLWQPAIIDTQAWHKLQKLEEQ